MGRYRLKWILNKDLDSTLKIKENFESLDKFTCQSLTTDEVRKEILNIDGYKATECREFPVKILK